MSVVPLGEKVAVIWMTGESRDHHVLVGTKIFVFSVMASLVAWHSQLRELVVIIEVKCPRCEADR